ncbi:hypothetical protein ACFY3M_51210 [Streptomyces mirabilis]|uniref:hypothetical protein n=1 Tax=Streptomyces mirabilis TaxID=68239 RepID=UPI0036B65B1E
MRLLAADGFTRGEKNAVIAKRLRVSVRSGERWRRSWCGRARGTAHVGPSRSGRRSRKVTSPRSSRSCWNASEEPPLLARCERDRPGLHLEGAFAHPRRPYDLGGRRREPGRGELVAFESVQGPLLSGTGAPPVSGARRSTCSRRSGSRNAMSSQVV